jgi:RNA polymerase sigma factor (sigma-70 family)
VSATDSTAAVEAAYRLEFPRVVAVLASYVNGDLGLAEELAQDSLIDALRQWPRDGIPHNPGAWLTAVGKRKAIDHFRRSRTLDAKYSDLGREFERAAVPSVEQEADMSTPEQIDDDRLRLIFVACHPVLPVRARVALTLRLVGGLTVPEIARAYLVSDGTIAQRIVRAKKSIAQAGVPFEVPGETDRAGRLDAVLEAIYLIYNEGYSATAGEEWLRPELCHEALRLGRVLAALMPDEAEVHGLVALMEFQSSRLAARTDAAGSPILLLDQDRRLWDRLLINRGEAALQRAEALNTAKPGAYTLQAAIAACHARAFSADETDWAKLAILYDELAQTSPSPVVELNRAVAVSRSTGPDAALPIVDALIEHGALERYHLLYSVRGDLLERMERHDEAATEFERAAGLATNLQERDLCLERARANRSASPGGIAT